MALRAAVMAVATAMWTLPVAPVKPALQMRESVAPTHAPSQRHKRPDQPRASRNRSRLGASREVPRCHWVSNRPLPQPRDKTRTPRNADERTLADLPERGSLARLVPHQPYAQGPNIAATERTLPRGRHRVLQEVPTAQARGRYGTGPCRCGDRARSRFASGSLAVRAFGWLGSDGCDSDLWNLVGVVERVKRWAVGGDAFMRVRGAGLVATRLH